MKVLSLCSVLLAFSVNAQQLLDPTRPAVSDVEGAATQAPAQWVLESIINKNGQYKAIISSKLYAQGDRVGPYTLTKITPRYVSLTQGNQTRRLELYSDEIKQ